MTDLNKRALGGLLRFLISLALFLFLPAWTLRYWQAWIFLAVFSGSVLLITLYLMKNDPQLLERRINAGPGAEKERSQRVIQLLTTVAFVALIVFPPIDHRLAWSRVPSSVVFAGDVLVVFGLLVVFLVFRENTFTSGIIEIDPEQKVVSTGPYALLRHPMYFGALIMLVGVPLALGSWWGVLLVIPISLAIGWRLLEEEAFLAKNLPGYAEYQNKVRYRLLPFVW